MSGLDSAAPDPPPRPLVEVGDTVVAGEADYRYGVGTLRLRVTEVGATRRAADTDDPWLELWGVDLRPDGAAVLHGQPPHPALVRVGRAQIRHNSGRHR